jgi:hypothetical protein
MKNISDSDFDQTLTLREAFQILETFILQYNARGEWSTAHLAGNIALSPDGCTVDPAQLDDFLSTSVGLLNDGRRRQWCQTG